MLSSRRKNQKTSFSSLVASLEPSTSNKAPVGSDKDILDVLRFDCLSSDPFQDQSVLTTVLSKYILSFRFRNKVIIECSGAPQPLQEIVAEFISTKSNNLHPMTACIMIRDMVFAYQNRVDQVKKILTKKKNENVLADVSVLNDTVTKISIGGGAYILHYRLMDCLPYRVEVKGNNDENAFLQFPLEESLRRLSHQRN